MKKLYILLSAVLLLAGSSCSDWLDVRPSDTLTQDELFAEGDGYRVTLNGVYRQMSETSLYGSALTWGYLDAAAQMYSSWYLGTNTLYDKFAGFEYTDSKVEDVIDDIWSKMYNSIANCNKLIAQIEEAPASKFRGGEEERQLIKARRWLCVPSSTWTSCVCSPPLLSRMTGRTTSPMWTRTPVPSRSTAPTGRCSTASSPTSRLPRSW